jgi:UDP-N-acetylglucosamine acyltransferase
MADTPLKTDLDTVDIEQIMRLLPHRYPFLLIDRMVDMKGDESGTGIKNVTVNEPFFQGHFPNYRVMPGVLIVEAMAQTCGALVAHNAKAYDIPQLVLFMGIDAAKFRKPVVPGDQLRLNVKKIRARGPVFRFGCEATVDGKIVAEAEISAMIVDQQNVKKTQGYVRPPATKSGIKIHPTAIVSPDAELGANCEVGPFCLVGDHVELGEGVKLLSHVVVTGHTTVGARTRIFPFASIGHEPQDLKFKGEKTTLTIGTDCTIREGVTMNPGTGGGGGRTVVGDRCLFLANAHIAHDVVVGNNVILSNGALVAGHCTVGDFVIMGGGAGVHQFVRIGKHAFVGGMAAVDADVIPYGMAFGNRATLAGLNVVGMKRLGFTREKIHHIRQAYRMLFANDATLAERIEDIEQDDAAGDSSVQEILTFIKSQSGRPLCQPRSG